MVVSFLKSSDCENFVNCAKVILVANISIFDIPKTKSGPIRVKSAGTDDGFKGEGAACGTSIIQVANQMVSSKSRLHSLEAPCPSTNNVHPDGFDPFTRRGSKSLPTTPLQSPNTSPKSRRKLHNRYFTGAFVDSKNAIQGSWILSGLLGVREQLNASTSTIAEEDAQSLRDSVDNVDMIDTKPEKVTKPQVFRPKPSELREMNFWSPTSM